MCKRFWLSQLGLRVCILGPDLSCLCFLRRSPSHPRAVAAGKVRAWAGSLMGEVRWGESPRPAPREGEVRGKRVSERCCFWPLGNFLPFLEPREPVNLEPQVLALAPRRAAPATAPAGGQLPPGRPPWRVSPEPLELNRVSRVKKIGFMDLPLRKPSSRRVPSHLHPPAPPHSRFPLPPSTLRTSRRKLQRQLRRGCGCKASLPASQICKLLRSGESTEGLSARLFQSSRGVGVVVIVRTAQAWASGVSCAWRFVSRLGWM